jgi:hypothetical protein
MNNMILKGQVLEQQSQAVPANVGIPPGEVSQIRQEADDLNKNRAFAQRYTQAFKELNSMSIPEKFAGAKMKYGPWKQKREAILTMLNTELARLVAHRYVTAEAASQSEAIAPNWDDNPDSARTKFNSTMQIFKDAESGMNLLRSHGLYSPFPEYNYGKSEPKKESKQSSKDPKVEKYAKEHKLDYNQALKIHTKRGYRH